MTQFDTAGLALVNGWRTNGLDIFFSTITWFGSLATLLPLAVLIAWNQSRRSSFRASTFVPLSLLLATMFSYITKIIVERPRPDIFSAAIPLPADWSFPSAHTMQVTAFLLAIVLLSKSRFLLTAAIGAALIILLVATSRLYLQVHFPSDVVFGIIAAIGCVMAARQLTFEQRSVS